MVAEKLQTLINTKAAIKAAIQAKGVTIPDDTPFSAYPSLIASIQSGGGGLYDSLSVLGYDEDTIAELNEMRDADIAYSKTITANAYIQNDERLLYYPQFENIAGMQKKFKNCINLLCAPNIVTNDSDFRETFYGCSSLKFISNVNAPNVTNMNSMFYGCSSLKFISNVNAPNVTNMGYMFYGCSSLTSVPQFDTSKVTNMNYMFCNCSSLTSVPQFDTSKVTNMANMFYGCSSLTSVPQFDTSNVTNMNYMFCNCSSLTSVPQFDTSKVTNMDYMFYGCSSLTSVPQFDTPNVMNITQMFYGCSSLTSVPQFDTSNVMNITQMFYGCSNLENLGGFVGLKVALDLTHCNKLTHDSLMNVINNLATITSSKTLKLGAANLAKLTDAEKAIATDKGWTLQ